MVVTNTETVPGKTIVEFYGLVSGRHGSCQACGKRYSGQPEHGSCQACGKRYSGQNLVGGELKSYTDLLNEAREEAIQRMFQEAESVGANAVVNVRFSTSSVTQGAAELFAYGTAVRVE